MSPGNEQQTRFERELERAHRAEEPHEEARPERRDEPERAEEPEREPERVEPARETDDVSTLESEGGADRPVLEADPESAEDTSSDPAPAPLEAPESTPESAEAPVRPLGDWLPGDLAEEPPMAGLEDPVLAEEPPVVEPLSPVQEEFGTSTERPDSNRPTNSTPNPTGESTPTNPSGSLAPTGQVASGDPVVSPPADSPPQRVSAPDLAAQRPEPTNASSGTQPSTPALVQESDAPVDLDTAFEPIADDELSKVVTRDEIDGVRQVRVSANTSPGASAASTVASAAIRPVEGSAVGAAAEAQPTEPTPPPRADVDRAADILRQVRLQISSEKRQALIQLEPKHLGRIAVRMSMRDGRLTAVLQVERPETLRALERQAPELKAALGAQNIETESFDMMLGFGRDQAGAQAGDGRSSGQTSGSHFTDLMDEGVEAIEPGSALAQRVVAEGGVDTYV